MGVIFALLLNPQGTLQNSTVDRLLSAIKLKSNPASPKRNVLSYESDLELQILEDIRKDSAFENFCISQIRCNFMFSFSSDIPSSVQSRIKQLIRKNYLENQDKQTVSQNLLLKFEIFTSKKDPYLQTAKDLPTDKKISTIEDLFLEHQNNESLLFQIDYFRQGNKIRESSFRINSPLEDFEQKKTR
jgi:hypothetical protein